MQRSLVDSAPSAEKTATVVDFWNRFAGDHLNSPTHWEANEAVRRFQWNLITGNPETNPITWFMTRFGPFASMASLCCGTGVLERHVAAHWLRTGGCITGFDISPRSIEMARAAAGDIPGIDYQVRDIDQALWPDIMYDAVFAHGALHHISRLDHVLGQIRRKVEPTGYLYVNDYVGPCRFQWSDVQMRLADAILAEVPGKFVVKRHVERCDPAALAKDDPSEAVCSNFILDTVAAHFEPVVRINRGGTLLAPIFGSACLDESIVKSGDGLAAIHHLCERESSLIRQGIIPSDHVLLVCRPRPENAENSP